MPAIDVFRLNHSMAFLPDRPPSVGGLVLIPECRRTTVALLAEFSASDCGRARAGLGYFKFAGSTSPVPPQTSQRRRPVSSHSLQFPILIPTMDFLPVP